MQTQGQPMVELSIKEGHPLEATTGNLNVLSLTSVKKKSLHPPNTQIATGLLSCCHGGKQGAVC